MAIKSVCPECETVYQLADSQAGKKVRCKNCQTVFEAKAPSPQTAVRNGPSSQTRTKPSTVTARRDDGEDERGQPHGGPVRSVEKKSALPLVLVTAVVGMGLLLLLSGASITYLLMRDNSTQVARPNTPPAPQPTVAPQPTPIPPAVPPAGRPPAIQPAPQADSQPVQPQPVQPAKPAPAKTSGSPLDARAQGELKKDDKEENIGRLTEERREHVRRATVYIRVKMPDGGIASGSGFFGCKEAHNIVLTNAHVVGMLSPESMRPQSVEVVVNSGENGEWKTTARILGVDRESDLAVLDIGNPPQQAPEPLTVKSAGGLRELDDLYVSGYPLGEGLGKEISMRKASVSAMRRKNGVLKHVQVEGGMDHGNSGGPVVDKSGAVVGVAVGGIEGHQINFAIPGERVHAILNGRLADLIVGQSYFLNDNKVAVPVAMDMIDPRNLIKEVGLEVWTGDKPADDKSGIRPAATAQPAKQAGDSQHVFYKLRYMAPEGKAEIVLPELPPGKVYWKQPCWIDATGQKHWASADAMTTLSQPVRRNPANLVLRYTQGAKRTLDLNLDNMFKVSSSQESDPFHIRTIAQLTEVVASTGPAGTLLRLRYKYPPSWDILLPDGRNVPNGKLEEVKSDLPRLITSVAQLDRLGNITQQAIEPTPLLRQLEQTKRKQAEAAKEFHGMLQQGLAALSIPLPGSGSVQPLESWRAERPLPIDTPGRTEAAKLDVNFTYLGTRRRDGREEAVISMDGAVRGKDDTFGGRASGQFMIDLASGQTILAETTMKLQLKALVSRPGEQLRELRLLLTMKFRLQRKM